MTTHTIRLPKNTDLIIDESELLKIFSMNKLINTCVEFALPEILSFLETNDLNLKDLAIKKKEESKRKIIILLKIEETRRIYFLENCIKRLRKLFSDSVKKEDVIKYLALLIKESKTYEKNETITEKLIEWKEYLEKSNKNYSLNAEWFKLKLLESEKIIEETKRESNKNATIKLSNN